MIIFSPLTSMYWDDFQETPPISTYLVAFFVGEFYAMQIRNIGVYTHASNVNQAVYIANKSPKLLEAMENFSGVEYMLPKIDLLAIPDFAAGAMENWGMNTYRQGKNKRILINLMFISNKVLNILIIYQGVVNVYLYKTM